MAIKVQGTTVIDDSRNIINIGIATVGSLDVNKISSDGIDYGQANYVLTSGGPSGNISWKVVTDVGAGILDAIFIRQNGSNVGSGTATTFDFYENFSLTQPSAGIASVRLANTLNIGGLNLSGVSTISVNSSADALRITQTGAGNALVVEDETNPDASPFVVNASGNVGVGTNNPTRKLYVRAGSGDGLYLDSSDQTGNSGSPVVRVRGQRTDGNTSQSFAGTLVLEKYRMDAAIQSTQNLGNIIFGGNFSTTPGIATGMTYGASISGVSEGSFSDIATAPSAIVFNTGTAGIGTILLANSTYGTEAVRITSNRNLLIGSSSETGTATQRLQVTGGAYVSGNLGIGSTSPTSRLDVVGDVKVSGIATFENGNTTYGTTTALSLELGRNNNANAGALKLWGTTSNAYGLIQATTSNLHIDTVVGGTYLNFYDGDFVSFGTGAGAESARFTGSTGTLTLGTTSATGTASQPLQVTGGAYVSTRLGIGQTNPNTALHIGPYNGNDLPHLYLGSGNNLFGWRFDIQDFGGGSVPLRIWRRLNGTDTEVITVLNQNGNVGIGTTNPTSKLVIQGDARVSGVVTATTFIGSLTGTATSTTNIPNLSGDVSSVNTTTTLATVNSNVGTYGGTGAIPVVTVNAKGLVTGVSTVAPNNGTLTLAVSGTGLSGSASFTANQSSSSTFTVTSNATSANTNDAIVSRNASGGFSAGIITATQFSTGSSGVGVNITTNTISGPAELTIDPAAVGDNTGSVRIKGDLYVDGTQFIVNSSTIELADFNVGIATTVGTNALLDGAGIGIGSTAIRKTITWNNSASALTSSEDWNLVSGKQYKINGTSVLNATTLGSGVVNSSLTSVGTLGQLNVSGISTFTNGPVFIGAATSTGTASQPLQVTGGAYVSGNLGVGATNPGEKLQVDGNLRLGVSTTSNYLAFYGTTGDLPGSYNHTYIGERIWSTGTERSELFLFKGNDADVSGGQDRIRLAAGQIRIDTFPSGTFVGGASFESVATSANLINRVVVHSTGEVGIGTDVLTGTSNQALQVGSSSVVRGAYISGNVGIGTTNPSYKLHVIGSFAATTKSFVIDHPTKEGMKLRYGSLEGPENGVYVRGRTQSSIIELPDYWTGLVDEDSITVNLTPIGRKSPLHSVIEISNNTIEIESANDVIDCFYTVFAERKDVEKLEVEF